MSSVRTANVEDGNDIVESINNGTTDGSKTILARVISSGANYQVSILSNLLLGSIAMARYNINEVKTK